MPIITKEEQERRRKEKEKRDARSSEAKAAETERKRQGQDFIGRREKIASQMAGAGTKRTQEQAARQAIAEGAGAPMSSVEGVQQKKKEGVKKLEASGAFEQVTPEEVPLTPESTRAEGIPLIGQGTSAIGLAINDLLGRGKAPKGGLGKPIGVDLPVGGETNREAALRVIRGNSVNEGITLSEGLGTFIESIPIVGGLARKYANGLTQTPSGNADNVLAEINKIKEAASTGQEKVRNGLEDPDYGLDRARSMEADISKLEGRIRLLINVSPILRSNNDEILKIQEEILEAREKVSRYRKASTFGLTAQLTGTGRIIPSDEQLFLELREIQNKNEKK